MVHLCDIHTRYQGKRKPKARCLKCWQLFLHVNPEAELTTAERNTLAVMTATVALDAEKEIHEAKHPW